MAKRNNKKSQPAPALTPQEIHEALTRKPFSPEQQEVLAQLRWGKSIQQAMSAIRYSRSAFDRWRERDYLFRLASDCARERYTEAVADAFHQCEGYSRRLIDMAQRNESAPLTLRVRCALAMVRRDPSQKWLPHPIDDLDPNRLRFDDFFPQDLPYPEDVESISGQDFLDREERRQAERKELEQPRSTASENTAPVPQPGRASDRGQAISAPHAASQQNPSLQRRGPAPVSTKANRLSPQPIPPQESLSTSEARPPKPHAAAQQNPSLQRRGPAPVSTKTNRLSPQPIPPQESLGTSEARPPKTHAALKEARATRHAALRAPREKPKTAPANNAHTAASAPNMHNLRTSPTQTTKSTSTQNTAKNAPEISEDTHTQRLDTVFLNHYTVHRHESAEDFAKLHAEMVRAYEPAIPREELTVLRIAQKHWALRRIDTFEMAISESIVTSTRQHHPEANGHAAIALKFLEATPSVAVRFFDRMRDYRNHHERSLERLDSLYEQIHQSWKRRESQNESTAPTYDSASPFATPKLPRGNCGA